MKVLLAIARCAVTVFWLIALLGMLSITREVLAARLSWNANLVVLTGLAVSVLAGLRLIQLTWTWRPRR